MGIKFQVNTNHKKELECPTRAEREINEHSPSHDSKCIVKLIFCEYDLLLFLLS